MKPKGGSGTNFGIDPDFAAHHGYEFLSDREPETCPVKGPRHLVFGLIELTKDVVQLVRRYADPSIFDCDEYLERVRCWASRAHGLDQNVARGRELHGVANEVGQNLSYPSRISDDGLGQRSVEVGDQLNVLAACRWLQKHQDIINRAFKIEGFGMKDQFLGFDLREIQHVVDDNQERFG